MTIAADRAQGATYPPGGFYAHIYPLAGILEEHRRISGRNVALGEESLEEYRQL